MSGKAKPHRLVVVSHVVHYAHQGRLFAYGPYSREIDIWADLFPEVVIAAPLRHEPPPPSSLPFGRSNITVAPVAEAGGDSFGAKLGLLLALPALVFGLARVLARADAIHVRCPGNLGLLGALMAPLFSGRLVAKYAGQWNGYVNEPRTVRMQRQVLRSRWWRGPVTVYGQWPGEPKNVVSFFTSMMTLDQVERATEVAAVKEFHSPLRVLYAGVLTSRKRVAALLDGVHIAREAGVKLQVAIVGDGPDDAALRQQAGELGLSGSIEFVGALPFDEALRWYEWADCLVLPSRHSEGWPKVVAEAMTYGVVPIAVAHGQVSAMVEGRGILLPSGSAEEIGAALQDLAGRPDHFRAMAHRAAAWASQYSLEGLRTAIGNLLSDRWKLQPPGLVARLADDGTHI